MQHDFGLRTSARKRAAKNSVSPASKFVRFLSVRDVAGTGNIDEFATGEVLDGLAAQYGPVA